MKDTFEKNVLGRKDDIRKTSIQTEIYISYLQMMYWLNRRIMLRIV